MIGSWRVVLTCTIAFYTYQSTFLSKKLNVEEKLTGRPSPTVHTRLRIGSTTNWANLGPFSKFNFDRSRVLIKQATAITKTILLL